MRLAYFKTFLMGTTALHAVPHFRPLLTRPLPWSGPQEMLPGARR
jgi:hypothetical protein